MNDGSMRVFLGNHATCVAAALDEAVEHGLPTGVGFAAQGLGMALDRHHEVGAGAFDGLDDAVVRPGNGADTSADRADGLMVERIDGDGVGLEQAP